MEPTKRGIPELLLSITLGALRIAGYMVCIAVLSTLDKIQPYVRPFLWRLTLLGTWLSVFFEFIVRVPDFPFWSAMQLFILCAAVLWVDHASREPDA